MDGNKRRIVEIHAARALEGLRKNNMEGYYAPTREDALNRVRELLHPGDTVAAGGSMTLSECGVLELLRGGDYRFADREAPGLSAEEKHELSLKAFRAEAYLCSANAVTLDGELYNVDGASNRVAALLYGPKSVVVVAGCNKLVQNVEEAVRRVKRTAAPSNCLRLHCATPCSKTGQCVSQRIGGGCASQARVCANFVVSARQRIPGRIKVILVGEALGF